MKYVGLGLLVILLAACSQQVIPGDSLESLITFSQKQMLFQGEVADAQFGRSVAISGDRMVVSCECFGKAEVAYIFERRITGTWTYVKTLNAQKPLYSYSDHQVAISGDTVVISSAETGIVYIYDRHQGGPGNWGLVMQFAGALGEGFGVSVALNGDTLVVGAYSSKIGNTEYQGSAYIFQRNHGGTNKWGKVKQLIASDGATFDSFGSSVSISGDTVVVGAYADDIATQSNQGSAYIYQRHQGGPNQWGQLKKLVASDGLDSDFFGDAVAVYGDTVVVGAWFTYYKDFKGSAYIFQRDHGGSNAWGQVKKIIPNDASRGDYFGAAVAIHKDTVVVGSIYDDVGVNTMQGSAYIFQRNQGGTNKWGQLKKLTASDGASIDYYGSALALSGRAVVIGAPLNDVDGKVDKGTAYIYE